MDPIAVKLGGSSLTTAGQFEKVAAIIRKIPPAAMPLRLRPASEALYFGV